MHRLSELATPSLGLCQIFVFCLAANLTRTGKVSSDPKGLVETPYYLTVFHESTFWVF